MAQLVKFHPDRIPRNPAWMPAVESHEEIPDDALPGLAYYRIGTERVYFTVGNGEVMEVQMARGGCRECGR